MVLATVANDTIPAADTLPAIIDRVRSRLAEARTSAEVLEIHRDAKAALKIAKHYETVRNATNQTQGDCIRIIKRAEIRLADEIDAGQANGEVATFKDGTAIRDHVQTSDQVATFDELGVNKRRVAEWRQLRDAGEQVIEDAIETALSEDRAPTEADIKRAVQGLPNRTQFTGETEWYTPAEYVEAARSCLGGIDLDPATSPVAQDTVQAERFFTSDDDGLSQEWQGRVWLNPPYAQPEIRYFVDKMIAEIDAGRTSQAIMLTHNYTDTGWFHAAARKSSAICFTRGRIRFVSPTGEIAQPTQGQAFFYFGSSTSRFHDTFSDFGFIL